MSTSEPVQQMWKADTGVKNVYGMKSGVHVPLFLTLALEGESSDSQPSTLCSGKEPQQPPAGLQSWYARIGKD